MPFTRLHFVMCRTSNHRDSFASWKRESLLLPVFGVPKGHLCANVEKAEKLNPGCHWIREDAAPWVNNSFLSTNGGLESAHGKKVGRQHGIRFALSACEANGRMARNLRTQEIWSKLSLDHWESLSKWQKGWWQPVQLKTPFAQFRNYKAAFYASNSIFAKVMFLWPSKMALLSRSLFWYFDKTKLNAFSHVPFATFSHISCALLLTKSC